MLWSRNSSEHDSSSPSPPPHQHSSSSHWGGSVVRRSLHRLRRTPTFSSVLSRGDDRLAVSPDTEFRYSLSRLPEHPGEQHEFTGSGAQDVGEAGISEWGRLEEAVCSLVHNQHLKQGQLTALHEDVRALLRSKAGPFIREYLETRLLGAACELQLTEVRAAPDLGVALASAWQHFYAYLLPNVEAIFVHVQSQRLSVAQTTLVAFRDRLVLPLEDELAALLETSVTPPLRQMLLVLQSVTEEYPPSERRLRLERLVARAVTPYLGFMGLYETGRPDPDLISGELEAARQRRPSVVNDQSMRRLLLRPLSIGGSGHRADTLTELFSQSAGRNHFQRSFSTRLRRTLS